MSSKRTGDHRVTVASFEFLPAAEIARGRLRAEGIHAELANQHLIQPYSVAAGGIELLVAATDAEQALAVLSRDYSDQLD